MWRGVLAGAGRLAGAGALFAAISGAVPVRGVFAADPAASPPYSEIVVFGDSLSDSGNAGRFSNGPVWVEVLAQRLGLPLRPSRRGGSNYAVGGALTHGRPIDVRGQLVAFFEDRGGAADPKALYVVFAGANDLLAGGCAGGRDRVARTAAVALVASVAELADRGAHDLLVPNLPDIGYAPVVRLQGAACVQEATHLTRIYNATLEERLQQMEARNAILINRLDVHGLTEGLLNDPASAGFRDIETPCLGAACDGLLFWDHLHPTTAAHAVLAEAALNVLTSAGTP